jgi:hypothetical protein
LLKNRQNLRIHPLQLIQHHTGERKRTFKLVGMALCQILQKQRCRQIALPAHFIQNTTVLFIVKIAALSPDIKVPKPSQPIGLVNLKIQTYKPLLFHDNNFE